MNKINDYMNLVSVKLFWIEKISVFNLENEDDVKCKEIINGFDKKVVNLSDKDYDDFENDWIILNNDIDVYISENYEL